jgi:hypothetical protein
MMRRNQWNPRCANLSVRYRICQKLDFSGDRRTRPNDKSVWPYRIFALELLRLKKIRNNCHFTTRKQENPRKTDEARLSAPHVRFHTLDFLQEGVVLLNHCTLKAAFAPTQRITRIVPDWRMEMLVPALLDNFDHFFDSHRKLLLSLMRLPRLILASPASRRVTIIFPEERVQL